MPRFRKPSPALIVAVVALVAALCGVAVASPLGSDGKVQLCYSQSALDDPGNGSSPVYIVNAGHPCDGDYPDTLTINQTGPRGLPGPTGGIGPRGPQGLPGADGVARLLGEKLKKQTLGDLGKVDRKSGSTDDKLDYLRRKLAALLHAKGQVDSDALARQMQKLLQALAAMQQQVQSINDVNQSVIRKLGG